MLFRPTVESDLDHLLRCTVDEPVSWARPDRLRSFLADGHYRHDRIWVAERDGEILARAVWWGFPDGGPAALDCLYVHPSVADPVALAAELLSHAHQVFGDAPAYHVFVPTGWRDDPAVTAALAWRWEAGSRAGLTEEFERLRYAWTPADPPPEPPARLVFREEPDDEAFVEVFRRVAEGSLDHHTRQALRTKDPDTQAREDLADYRSMPGDRSWWRLAFTQDGTQDGIQDGTQDGIQDATRDDTRDDTRDGSRGGARDGELVGFALPSANQSGPVVGYLGVLPEHRGHGYVSELLAEITRSHAGRGAERIAADTDTTNIPMARAFERAGYRLFAVRLVLSADPAPA